jgi:CDGSH-type Zn-finger protein
MSMQPGEQPVVTITPLDRGPNLVKGTIKIVMPSGRVLVTEQTTKLCRCGHSQDKPFCDGSHKQVGFSSVEGGPDTHQGP